MDASIAKAFAQAGARAIGIIGRREHLLKSNIANIVALPTNTDIKVDYAVSDVSQYGQISAAFEKLPIALGMVDILVSNARFLPKPTPLRSADDKESDLPGYFAVWLASPEAKFLKGKFVWANWDVDELRLRAKEIMEPKALELTLVGPAFKSKIRYKYCTIPKNL
ncbi:hypothetical protein B0J14DRAFT_699935 [Halenospora varia]|nr:hypothetical protein B0J14DRAFT_699935 [Halenospora varia]